MINQTQKETMIQTLQPIRPNRIGVFGSFTRGENRAGSDLDILVYFDQTNKVSLLNLIAAKQERSEALGIKVDLITERSLNPLIRPYIEKDLKIIFE